MSVERNANSRAAHTVEETHTLSVALDGRIYDPAGAPIGSLHDGLAATQLPFRSAFVPMEDWVRGETSRWRAISAGRPDPSIAPPDAYVTEILLPWFLSEMRKRNSPDLRAVPGGLLPKKGWSLIMPNGYLFPDGTIQLIGDKRPRPLRADDEENLLCRVRLSKLGEPPPRARDR